MAIEFTCPACGARLCAWESSAGRHVPCDDCREIVVVPEPEPGPRPPPFGPHPDTGEPEPASSGRAGVAWAVGILGVGLVAGLIGVVWWAATRPTEPQWQTLNSRAGGFTVELPSASLGDVLNHPLIRRPPGMASEGTMFEGQPYLVMWIDFPGPPGGANAEEVIDMFVRGARQGVFLGDVTPGGWLAVDGFKARDVLVTNMGNAALARVVVADTRLYVLMAGSKEPTTDPKVRRFLDSFRITEPRLVGGRLRA